MAKASTITEYLWKYPTNGQVWSVAITTNGGYIAAGSGIWDIASGQKSGDVYLFPSPKMCKQAIQKAEKAIQQAELLGLNPSAAKKLISQAKHEFSEGRYNQALKLANQSYFHAIDIDGDGITNNKDFAPTIPNNYIYISASCITTAITLIFLRIELNRRRRKREYETKKKEVINKIEKIIK